MVSYVLKTRIRLQSLVRWISLPLYLLNQQLAISNQLYSVICCLYSTNFYVLNIKQMETVFVVVRNNLFACIVHLKFVFESVASRIHNELAQFWDQCRVYRNVECWFLELPHVPNADSEKVPSDNLVFVFGKTKIRNYL